MNNDFEHQEQSALIKWWAFACNTFGVKEEMLFAIPNGGLRKIQVAMKLKAEGVRSGVPDLMLAVPHGQYHGLFIEMKKSEGGRASDNQKTMMRNLITLGYKAVICHGWMAAKQCIEQYFKGD